jgi:hypothetical protein
MTDSACHALISLHEVVAAAGDSHRRIRRTPLAYRLGALVCPPDDVTVLVVARDRMAVRRSGAQLAKDVGRDCGDADGT